VNVADAVHAYLQQIRVRGKPAATSKLASEIGKKKTVSIRKHCKKTSEKIEEIHIYRNKTEKLL